MTVRGRSSLILTCSLNIADGLMSIYLCVVINSYFIHEANIAYDVLYWKQSFVCKMSGVIIMTSVMASNLTTMLNALNRFIVIVWKPFQRYGLTSRQSIVGLLLIWIMSIVIPLLSAVATQSDILNSACIILGGSLYLPYAVIYIIVNCLLFMCVTLFYAQVAHSVYLSGKIQKSHQKVKQITGRLGAVILTNFLASMTITLLSVLSLFTYVPASLESMLAFWLFTVNSCANPVLNTFTHDILQTALQYLSISNLVSSFKHAKSKTFHFRCKAEMDTRMSELRGVR